MNHEALLNLLSECRTFLSQSAVMPNEDYERELSALIDRLDDVLSAGEDGDREACQILGSGVAHRDDGRGRCIDCGAFL